MTDLTLVALDDLIDECFRRCEHGIIYLLKSNANGAMSFKKRIHGSPVVRAGAIRIMQVESDQEVQETDSLPPDEF